MATPVMTQVTTTFGSKETDTSKILPSKTSSISTSVSTSISPSQPTSAEEQVIDTLLF